MSCAQSPASTAIDAAQKPDAVSAFPDDAAILALIKSRVDEGRAVGIVLGVLDADGATRIVSYGNAGPGAQPLAPQRFQDWLGHQGFHRDAPRRHGEQGRSKAR